LLQEKKRLEADLLANQQALRKSQVERTSVFGQKKSDIRQSNQELEARHADKKNEKIKRGKSVRRNQQALGKSQARKNSTSGKRR